MESGGKQTDLKIVVLGPSSVGKTSIILRYCKDSFDSNMQSTIGASFFTHAVECSGREATLMLWDTAGEERFRSVAPVLLRGANGMILVYDVTQPQSLSELDTYLDMFLENVQHSPTAQLPILLVGNKSDMPFHAILKADAESWCEKRRVAIHRNVSAKTGEGINEAVLELVELILKISDNCSTISTIDATQIQESRGSGGSCC